MNMTLPVLAAVALLATACASAPDPATAGAQTAQPPPSPTSSRPPALQTWAIPGDEVFPEGIAVDPGGQTFYVGSTSDGTVYRGDTGDPDAGMEVFLEPGADDRTTVTGLSVDDDGRLFVAGRDSNRLFVYDTADGRLLADFQPPAVDRTLLNDVVVTNDAAYITDSFRPTIFRITLESGDIGQLEPWIDLTDSPITYESGFNLNGIVSSDDGSALLTVQYNTGQLYRIDTASGNIDEVDLGGETLRTGDGLVLDDTLLHVVLGGPGEVVTIRLDQGLATGEVVATTTRQEWRAPTTIAAAGGRLLVVNSQLDMAGGDRQANLPFTVSAFPAPTPTDDGE